MRFRCLIAHAVLRALCALVFASTGVAATAAAVDVTAPTHEAADLIDRGRYQMRADPDAGRVLLERALMVLAARPDVDLQIRAHLMLCDYFSERDRVAARREIERAQALLPRTQRPGLRAGLLGCEGEIHEYSGDNVQAMKLYQESVKVAESAGDAEMLANALYQRGYLRGVQGDFAVGLADLQRAVAMYDKLDQPEQSRTVVNSIAILYNRMGDYEQARRYYESSLKAQRVAGFTREQVVTQHNLGRVLENLKDWDAAQRTFESVLALSREIGYARGEAYALRGLASVRNARNAPAEAIALLDAAVAAQREADERLRAQILLQRGIALRALQRPVDSINALQTALDIFRKADSLAEIGATHGELARSLAAVGDWRSAYSHQLQMHGTTSDLLQRQLDQRFATLRVEFNTAAREKENVLLQREKEVTEQALAHEKRATTLQAAVIALVLVLAALLAGLAWRQRRASEAMRSLAMTDDLTGLPNRRRVITRLEQMMAIRGSRTALLIADIDRFKSINDTYGHPVGDEVLRLVAQAMRDITREPIALGRLGGEEFLLALPYADEAVAQRLAERLCNEVGALDVERWLPGRQITVSVGVALSQPGDNASTLLRRADEALYAAKSGGRNRVVMERVAVTLPANASVAPA